MDYLKKLADWKVASVIFLIVTLIFSFSLFGVWGNWGTLDWDQHMFYEGSARASLVEYSQFPLWNPWQCGGNVLLVNPQSSFLSLHFPLTLLFGVTTGMKLGIMLYLFVGLLGMWFVSRKLQFGILSSYVVSILLFLSGVYAVRMMVGHTNWYHLAWIPWIFYFVLRSKECWKYVLPAACLLVLIFLGGGIHPFVIAVLVLLLYAIAMLIKEKNLRLLYCVLLVLILFLPLASIKLLPMLSVYDGMLPITQDDIQPNSFFQLFSSLSSRDVDLEQQFISVTTDGYEVVWGMHEYFGYVGLFPLLLLVLSFVFWKKMRWEFGLLSLVVAFFILSQQYLPSLWKLFSFVPGLSLFHGPSRFTFAFIFFLALAIGSLLTSFEKRKGKYAYLVLLLLFVYLLVDLTLVNGGLLADGFTVTAHDYLERGDFYHVLAAGDEQYTAQYALFLRNKGVWNCYERFHPLESATPQRATQGEFKVAYHGEAYVLETKEKLSFDFSPNMFVVDVSGKSGTVVLNQNYVRGWKVKVDGVHKYVEEADGLVTVSVNNAREVAFFYRPNAFYGGLFVSILSVLGSLWLFFGKKIR
jgi:hypothetical protein